MGHRLDRGRDENVSFRNHGPLLGAILRNALDPFRFTFRRKGSVAVLFCVIE